MARPVKKTQPARTPARRREPVTVSPCRALIPQDTAAVRAQHLRACEKAIAAYLRRKQIDEQHRLDEEAYDRWIQIVLGPLRTELRATLDERRAAYVAYRQAQQRAGIRPSMLDELNDVLHGMAVPPEPGAAQAAHASDTHKTAFHGRVAYEREFGEDERSDRMEAIEEYAGMAGVSADIIADEMKTMYRRICRAMHPDTGSKVPDNMAWLWDAAQAAYHAGDYFELANVETRLMIEQGVYRQFTTVADVISFTQRVTEITGIMRARIQFYKQSPAWQFSQWEEEKRARMQRDAAQALQLRIDQCRRVTAFYEMESHEIGKRQERQAAEEARRRCLREQARVKDGAAPPPRRRRAPAPEPGLQPEFPF